MLRYMYLIFICAVMISCQTSQKNKSEKSDKNNLESAPKLTKPVVQKIWIPEKIDDDGLTMTGGHWKYLINRGSTWAN